MANIVGKVYRVLNLLVLLLLCIVNMRLVVANHELKAIFIFGDSTMDVGTNNNLNGCLATANKPYNGIDYPYSIPTGRFSNGLNTADLLAREVCGYTLSPPPYLTLVQHLSDFKRDILRGVNFASGGAGVFDDTGKASFVNVVPMSEQIQQFGLVRGNITELLVTPNVSNDLISKSLFLISVGSNDIFDYLQAFSPIPSETLVQYFVGNYTMHLQNLYNFGARKFAIIGVPPLGCTPSARVFNNSNCLTAANDLALAFYNQTTVLLQKLSTQYPDLNYSLGNAYQMTIAVIDNAAANGFKNFTSACCGNGTVSCQPGVNLCANRNEYLFWDKFHPTQAASEMAALTLSYAEGAEYVTPMNFSRLALI